MSYKSVTWTYVAFGTRLHSGSWAPLFFFVFFWDLFSRVILGVLYKHQEQQKGQGTKQQSQREGESETVTKGGSRKGIPLNEGEVGVRKEE